MPEPEIPEDMYDVEGEEGGGQLLAVFRTCPECHSTVLCLLESELKGCAQHNAVQEQSSVEMGMGEQKAMGQTMGARNFGRSENPLS